MFIHLIFIRKHSSIKVFYALCNGSLRYIF